MDILSLWNKIKQSASVEQLTGSCIAPLVIRQESLLQDSQGCSFVCGKQQMHVCLRRPASSSVEPEEEYLERPAERKLAGGLRNDEKLFAEEEEDEAENDATFQTPVKLLPPSLGSKIRAVGSSTVQSLYDECRVAERTVNRAGVGSGSGPSRTSDIESFSTLRASSAMESVIDTPGVEDRCMASQIVHQSAALLRPHSSSMAAISCKPRAATQQQQPSPSPRTIRDQYNSSYLSVVATETAGRPPTRVTTFAELVHLLKTSNNEMEIRLEPLAREPLSAARNHNKAAPGDIIAVEQGVAGFGPDQQHVATVLAGSINGTMRTKEVLENGVKAQCRLWDLLYPDLPVCASPSRRCSPMEVRSCSHYANFGVVKTRECWGVWTLPLKELVSKRAKDVNCLVVFVNCYAVLVALQPISSSDIIWLSSLDDRKNAQKLLQTVSQAPVKMTLSHFPEPVVAQPVISKVAEKKVPGRDESAICTASTSDDAPGTEELNAAQWMEKFAEHETKWIKLSRDLERSLPTWPRPTACIKLCDAVRMFSSTIDVACALGTPNPKVDALLFELAAVLEKMKPKVKEMTKMPADAFIAQHGLTIAAGEIRSLYNTCNAVWDASEAVHKQAMNSKLKGNEASMKK